MAILLMAEVRGEWPDCFELTEGVCIRTSLNILIWFLDHDSEFIVLKCSHQISVHLWDVLE